MPLSGAKGRRRKQVVCMVGRNHLRPSSAQCTRYDWMCPTGRCIDWPTAMLLDACSWRLLPPVLWPMCRLPMTDRKLHNISVAFIRICQCRIFYKNISRTPAVSSTNFGSILIFASCVVGTCTIIYYVGEFFHNGRGHIVLLKHKHVDSLYIRVYTYFLENISRTSAVSSTNFRSIFIFASCVVGACNILCEWVIIRRGPISCSL